VPDTEPNPKGNPATSLAYMWKCDHCGLVNHTLTWTKELTKIEAEIHMEDWGVPLKLGCEGGKLVQVLIQEIGDA